MNGADSLALDIEYGVPQGSILGPLLFLLYVNDLSFFTNINILSFADDTTIFGSSNSTQRLFEESNEKVNSLYKWFCANELFLNAQKN